MRPEQLQELAHEIVGAIQEALTAYHKSGTNTNKRASDIVSIQNALTIAHAKINTISDTHALLHSFFFPLCSDLDAVFYSETYTRWKTGRSELQDKVAYCIYTYWKRINELTFDALDIAEKTRVISNHLAGTINLFQRRNKKPVSEIASQYIEHLCQHFFKSYGTPPYAHLSPFITSTEHAGSAMDQDFYKFLAKYISQHPPYINCLTITQETQPDLVADVWHTERSRACLLYLHDWHDSPESAVLLAQLMTAANIEVHALHLLGHGENYSHDTVSIRALLDQFKRYYAHLCETTRGAPIILAGHGMGGAIIAACLNDIPTDTLRQIILFSPAFSASRLDMFAEKMPVVHRDTSTIVATQRSQSLWFGGRGPANPSYGVKSLFSANPDDLYALMRRGCGVFTALERLPAPTILVYGARDYSVNPSLLASLESRVDTVIKHKDYDHVPHVFPVCGGMNTVNAVIAAVNATLGLRENAADLPASPPAAAAAAAPSSLSP